MKNWISILGVFLLAIMLTGCSTTSSPVPDNSKAYIGLFSGAIVGGLAGSAAAQNTGGRVRAIAFGALVGAIAGGAIGLLISDMDRERAEAKARHDAADQANNWRHVSGPYTPQPVIQTAAKTMPVKAQLAEKKAPVPPKQAVAETKKEANTVKPEKKKNEVASTPTNPPAAEKDKAVSLLSHLPSFQWFVNDNKQEEVG